MTHIPWTPQEMKILKEMAEAGKTAEDVARVLKSRTKDAIQAKGYNLRLSFHGKPEIDFEEFRRILKQTRPH